MVHGRHVVGHLPHVVQGHARHFLALVEQQIGQGGLRAFDLGRQQRLLADVEVDEQFRIREQRRHPVQPSHGLRRLVEQGIDACQVQGRVRGQGRGQMGAHRLAAEGRRDMASEALVPDLARQGTEPLSRVSVIKG